MSQTCRWPVEAQVRSSSRCPRFSQGPRYADTCCRVSSALKCCWKCWVRWHGRGWVCSSRPQSPQPPSQIWSQTTLYNLQPTIDPLQSGTGIIEKSGYYQHTFKVLSVVCYDFWMSMPGGNGFPDRGVTVRNERQQFPQAVAFFLSK